MATSQSLAQENGLSVCAPQIHLSGTGPGGGPLAFTSWWDNKGVAPCYRKFPLALRIRNATRAEILLTTVDVTTCLPGDSLFDGSVTVPSALPAGNYEIDLGIPDPQSKTPKVKLAIEGCRDDGWYRLGSIKVEGHASAPSP